MSFDILFVHGTGVRGKGYKKAFDNIKDQLENPKSPWEGLDSDLHVHECRWGLDHGTALFAGGASIPQRQNNQLNEDEESEEVPLGLWNLLYQDPLFELRIVHQKQGIENANSRPPFDIGGSITGLSLDNKPELHNLFEKAGIAKVFDEALREITGDPDYQEAVRAAQTPLGNYYGAIARALVAQSVILAEDTYSERNLFFSNPDDREEIVDKLIDVMGGQGQGWLGDVVKKAVLFMIKRELTMNHKPGHSPFTAGVGRLVGDILRYQARGQSIRKSIREKIEQLDNPVVLLAHSLGGIICVDLLLEPDPPPQVKLLVTVGSQAPLLYEMDALVGMPYQSDARLPSTFPKWLNIYDENDLASYIASKVFSDDRDNKIADFHVASGKLFPDSHGAYWENEQVFQKIVDTLKTLSV